MASYRKLYSVDRLPIFQNRMYRSAAEARDCPKGDICLVEDLATGLIFNAAFRPELMDYDEHYQNEQAASPAFQSHLESVANLIERNIGKAKIVEVGCGKGYFLEMLLAKGFDVTGYDPTYEGTNPRVKRQYFSAGVTERADGLVLRHVLEHIPNPVAFLEQLKMANGGGGRIYIEVPCLDWIIRHKAWFDIFYEHVNYFRMSDFRRIFGEIIDAGRLFGGQYLYVVAELASLRRPVIDMQDRVQFPNDFTSGIGRIMEKTKRSQKVAIWGGASKGVIFALQLERAGRHCDMVIDINPAKQGKYLPSTGLQVLSPEEGLSRLPSGATICVMNSNYLDEIKAMAGQNFLYEAIDHD